METSIETEYGCLRGDPRGALEQIWYEINSALESEIVPVGVTTTFLARLKLKCELGLEIQNDIGS